jgi:hypothetical protein
MYFYLIVIFTITLGSEHMRLCIAYTSQTFIWCIFNYDKEKITSISSLSFPYLKHIFYFLISYFYAITITYVIFFFKKEIITLSSLLVV